MERIVLSGPSGKIIGNVDGELGSSNVAVIDRIQRPESPPIEWKDMREQLPRYRATYELGSKAIEEAEIVLPTAAADRLQELFERTYIQTKPLDPIPAIDCVTFVERVAFARKQTFDLKSIAYNSDNRYVNPNRPYRILGALAGKEGLHFTHSLYTTDMPHTALSVMGRQGVLTLMPTLELVKHYKSSTIAPAEDIRDVNGRNIMAVQVERHSKSK